MLITIVGTPGKIAVVPSALHGANITQSSARIRIADHLADRRYVRQVLRSEVATRQYEANRLGTGVPRLNIHHVRDLELPVPPLAEQRRIADVLDRAEALRAKRRAALAQLDTLTQAVFLDLFGDPVASAGRWSRVRLVDVLSVPLRNGLSPSNSGTVPAKVLTLSAITHGSFDASCWKLSSFRSAPPANQSADANDLLICRGNGNRELVGRGRFPSGSLSDVTFPDTMIAARIDADRVRPAFVEHVWNGREVRAQIESSARTTNGTFKVNQEALERVEFLLPSLELQTEFARRVAAVEKLKAAQRASLSELDALFATLQHRAFRGEL